MKKIVWIVLAALIALFLLWRIVQLSLGSGKAGPNTAGRPPVAVEIDSVRSGYLSESRQLTGTVYPQYSYVIAPKVSGRIVELSKRIGDWVESGEVLVRIDDAEYQQGVIEAEANLKIAQAAMNEAKTQFNLARQEQDRVRSLQAKGIASGAELDAAVSNHSAQESRFALAQAQVDQRRAALKSAEIRLSYSVLTASKPGYVGERFVDEGALLAPNNAVLTVLGIDSVIIRTHIIEKDYARIKVGQAASVSVDAFGDHVFRGLVTRISPMLQETSRVAQMEVEVVNDSLLLKPGMFARVDVRTAERSDARYIPSKALVRKEGKSGVFMVDSNEAVARFVTVSTGISNHDFTEIVDPVLEGILVTLGQHLLEDGSPVILPKASPR